MLDLFPVTGLLCSLWVCKLRTHSFRYLEVYRCALTSSALVSDFDLSPRLLVRLPLKIIRLLFVAFTDSRIPSALLIQHALAAKRGILT